MNVSRPLWWLPPVALVYVVVHICGVALGMAYRDGSAMAYVLSAPDHPLDWLFVLSLAIVGFAAVRWLYHRVRPHETPEWAVR